MSSLKSYTIILSTDLSIRAINVIRATLPERSIMHPITIADVIDNKELIFSHRACSERTKKEIIMLITEYALT